VTDLSAAWWSGQPLNESELAILTIETTTADPLERAGMVETQLGWTRAYYEENVRCLLVDDRARNLAPGLVDVLAQRYPGPPSLRSWEDAEAFTRPDHL
jgi:hypothetical protein